MNTIRACLLAVQWWVFEEESFALFAAKFFLVFIVPPVAALFVAAWAFSFVESSEAACLRAGRGWAVAGHHRALIYNPSLKTMTMRTVTDYGCFEVRR